MRGQFEEAHEKRFDNIMYNNSKMKIINRFRITFSFCSFKIREMKDVYGCEPYSSVGLLKRQMSGEIKRIADVKIPH